MAETLPGDAPQEPAPAPEFQVPDLSAEALEKDPFAAALMKPVDAAGTPAPQESPATYEIAADAAALTSEGPSMSPEEVDAMMVAMAREGAPTEVLVTDLPGIQATQAAEVREILGRIEDAKLCGILRQVWSSRTLLRQCLNGATGEVDFAYRYIELSHDKMSPSRRYDIARDEKRKLSHPDPTWLDSDQLEETTKQRPRSAEPDDEPEFDLALSTEDFVPPVPESDSEFELSLEGGLDLPSSAPSGQMRQSIIGSKGGKEIVDMLRYVWKNKEPLQQLLDVEQYEHLVKFLPESSLPLRRRAVQTLKVDPAMRSQAPKEILERYTRRSRG